MEQVLPQEIGSTLFYYAARILWDHSTPISTTVSKSWNEIL